MIFDLIAANGGGRKYLFSNGVCYDSISFFNSYAETVIKMEIDTSGATFTTTGDVNSLYLLHFTICSIDVSKIQKVYVEFDAFTLPEGTDTTYFNRTGFYVSTYDLPGQAYSDHFSFVPVERSNEPFTVEIDISNIEQDVSNIAQNVNLCFYAMAASDESALGSVVKVRSIWYI